MYTSAVLGVVLSVLFIGACIVSYGNLPRARAAASDNLTGYAWSETIGWISFNCTDDASCATSDYGVNLDIGTGDLSGHAWSENIGWVSFTASELGGCPSGGTCKAWFDGARLRGWARACAGAPNKDDCTSGARADGWDGWLSLSCLDAPGGSVCGQSNYAVTLSGNAFQGFAWGDDVVGWVEFNPVFGGVFIDSSGISIAFDANPVAVNAGGSSLLAWSSTGATSCREAGSSGTHGGSWTNANQPLAGSENIPNITTSSTFTIMCENVTTSASEVATVTVNPPNFSIDVFPASVEMVFAGGGASASPTTVRVLPESGFNRDVRVCDHIAPCGNTTSIAGIPLTYDIADPILSPSEYAAGTALELSVATSLPSGPHPILICATDSVLPPRCANLTVNADNKYFNIEEF